MSHAEAMTAVRQLDFVEKHLRPCAGRMTTIEDAYMAVLLPSAVGKPDDHVLFRQGALAYKMNSGFAGKKKKAKVITKAMAAPGAHNTGKTGGGTTGGGAGYNR